MEMLQYLEQFNLLSVFVRLALATVLGGLIGLERGSHGQPAGLRTFALVCLGATIAMITDEYLVETYQTGDPARLAAQVISGIGFLGVGTIIVTCQGIDDGGVSLDDSLLRNCHWRWLYLGESDRLSVYCICHDSTDIFKSLCG